MPKLQHEILLKIPPDVAEETNNPTRVELHWAPYHPAVTVTAMLFCGEYLCLG